jgi:TIR domain
MSQIFISHGQEDTWIAEQIAECVKGSGASPFLDEANMHAGDNFREILKREISDCDELLVLLTPWSTDRRWVWVELGAAWSLGKRIVAILHGLTLEQLDQLRGRRAVLEDINVIHLNDFNKYLLQLTNRAR